MQQKKTFLDRRAQEEMIGFVMIILLVAVIFLVFLSILVRKTPPVRDQNAELSQFLDAVVSITTNCSVNNYHFLSFSELVEKCYASAGTCDSGEDPCKLLSSTFKGAIESSWLFDRYSANPGYLANIRKPEGTSLLPNPPSIPFSGVGGTDRIFAEKPIYTSGGTVTIYIEKHLPKR